MKTFKEILLEEIPKNGRQHTDKSLADFKKRQEADAKRDLEADNKRKKDLADPNSELSKKLKIAPVWTKLEGQDILQIKGSKYAALPATGKKNSAKFIIFDVNTRKEITYLKKTEVENWLIRKYKDE